MSRKKEEQKTYALHQEQLEYTCGEYKQHDDERPTQRFDGYEKNKIQKIKFSYFISDIFSTKKDGDSCNKKMENLRRNGAGRG